MDYFGFTVFTLLRPSVCIFVSLCYSYHLDKCTKSNKFSVLGCFFFHCLLTIIFLPMDHPLLRIRFNRIESEPYDIEYGYCVVYWFILHIITMRTESQMRRSDILSSWSNCKIYSTKFGGDFEMLWNDLEYLHSNALLRTMNQCTNSNIQFKTLCVLILSYTSWSINGCSKQCFYCYRCM